MQSFFVLKHNLFLKTIYINMFLIDCFRGEQEVADNFDIWVPVIASSLLSYYEGEAPRNYPLHKDFKRIETLKIKVKDIETYRKGSLIEVILDLEILILLEDNSGKIEMFRTLERFRQKVASQEFNNEFDIKGDYQYITEIKDLNVEGDLHHDRISITIRICFDIMVLQNRRVSLADEVKLNINEAKAVPPYQQKTENGEKVKLQSNVNKLRKENQDLLRQLSIYKKDLISLKRGIQKAEARSFGLKRENREYEKRIDDLHIQLKNVKEQLSGVIKPPEVGYLNPPLNTYNTRANMYQKIAKYFSNILL